MGRSLRLGKAAAGFLVVAGLVLALSLPLAAVQALSVNDISLLLTAGTTSQKMVTMVAERGVNFRMSPDLAKQFRKQGASAELIQAIQNASQNVFPAPAVEPSAATPPPARSAEKPPPTPLERRIREAVGGPSRATTGPEPSGNPYSEGSDKPPVMKRASKPAPAPDLSNPSPAEIQDIIQKFAANEALFEEARKNYTYHQINKVETLDADGNVSGEWEQDWDILFDNNGNRIEKVTYAPTGTLTAIQMTEQDYHQLRHIQVFVVTPAELPEYQIKYLGHVVLDKLTAYVFSVRPKEIKKHHQYFDGVVWVDDHDLQIVKTEGRQVPQITQGSNQNLFPRFSTWRQQIDGKFWFPTFTMADDTLYFSNGPVHIKEIVRYTDYKQFRSTSKIKMVGVAGGSKPQQPSQPSTKDSPQK